MSKFDEKRLIREVSDKMRDVMLDHRGLNEYVSSRHPGTREEDAPFEVWKAFSDDWYRMCDAIIQTVVAEQQDMRDNVVISPSFGITVSTKGAEVVPIKKGD